MEGNGSTGDLVMPNSEGKKKPIGQVRATQKRKRKPEYTRVNAAGVESMKGSESTQEEKYRMLVQNLPCVVYSAYPGKAGPTTFMSNKWKDWTGYSPEKLYRDPEAWPRCIHPDDREYAVNAYIEACRDRMAYNLDYRIIHKDTGQLRYVRDQGHLSKDEKGAVVRIDGIITDITEFKKTKNELDKYKDRLEELVRKRTAELTSAYETLNVENKERKRAEQALREVEREKTTVLENLSDLIVYRDRDMVTLLSSKSMANWHGMSQDQIVGRVCYKARYGRDEPCEECHIIEAMKSGQRQELEKQLPGERCWHVIVDPVFSDSGQVIGTIEVSQDITERKQSEEALRETTNLLETIFEHTHMLVACLDPQFNFVRVNRAYAEADERQTSFFHGKNHFDLYPNEENEVIFRRVVETGIPYFAYARPFEYAEHPERGVSYWDWSLVPIKNQQGIVSGMVLTLVDVTARKRAEGALKASEEKLNAMLQSISDHMSMMDKDLNIIWANDVAKRRFGDDIIGKKCYEVYHGRQNPCEPSPCLTLRAFQDGGVHEHDTKIADNDGNNVWFHCVANVALRDNEGKAIAVLEVSTDITERRQAEEALSISSDIVRSIPSGLFTYKYEPPDKLFLLDGNPAVERLANIKVSECIGKEFNDIWPHARDIGITDNYLKVMKTGKAFETEDQYYEDEKLEGIFRICAFPMSKELLGVAFENITQQKLAEDALTESESRFRELVENMREVFWMENADGTELLYISPTYEQVWGRSCQSFYENPGDWIESIHPEDRQRVTEAFSQLRETGEYSEEFRIVRPDGTIRWIWDRGVPIRNKFDEVIRVAGVAEDVTDRKQTEEALRESEEKFRYLAEQSPNMIFINKKGKVVYANKKCEKVLGYKREELCSPDFDFRTLVTPESLDLINDSFIRHLKGEEVQPYDYTIISKDGMRIEVINASKLIQYEGQAAILGIVTDITERKRAEQALRESEERLKILFESAPDTIYLVDSEGRFMDANRAAFELIGFARDEVIGKSLAELDLLSAGQLSKAKENLKKVVTGKLSGPNEYTLKRKDGSLISVEVRTFPVKIGGKMLTLGIARDITEHKRTEKELLEHQAKLKSLASQLSLTEEFERHRLATDLHDQISQSLVISKIKLDQLRKSSTSDEFNRPIEDICNCLGQIIDDTRTLTFDLSYPILYELGFEAAVAEWLTDQIQEKHGIRTEFVDDGYLKPLDDDIRVLLFRNVRELLINVVKHAQANKVRVSIRKVKDNIRVSVEDDGVGFDPVEVTSMAAKRAEFGLFSIRERLEQLGGMIEIDSKPGRGSKITMTAPLKNEDDADGV
jgi:PAS domain S-box-containing protein